MAGDGFESSFGKTSRTGEKLQDFGGGNPVCCMGLDVVERNCNGHVFPVVFPGGASCDCRGFLELLHDRLAGPCAYQSFKYRDGLPSGLFKARGDAG